MQHAHSEYWKEPSSGLAVLPAAKRKKARCGKKQAPQCFTGCKASFSTQLTDGLRYTLHHCCINDGHRRLLIRHWAGARGGLVSTIVGTLRYLRRTLLAAGFSRLQGCDAWGPAGFHDNIFCIPRAAARQQAPAGCWAAARRGLAGSDDTIFCTLRATVRQPAPAGCRAAARGGFAGSNDTMFCHLRVAVRQSGSAGCWRVPPAIWPPPCPGKPLNSP
jgi:hypothetical protein